MKTVYIIRHAEKPDNNYNIHLSEDGRDRARNLAKVFSHSIVFNDINFLIAADKSKHSNRSVETLEWLSKYLGLIIHHEFDDDEYKDLVKRIKSGKKYADATILIAWHHENIPNIAKAFGVKSADLPSKSWPDEDFDTIWALDVGSVATYISKHQQGFKP